MSAQPNLSQFKPGSLGAPPAGPTGPNRMLPWIRTAMTGGLIVTLGVYGAQLLFPEGIKPGTVMGWLAGDTITAEILASRDARIDVDRRIADATAQANAKAQADVIAIQQTLEARSQGLTGLSAAAVVADWGCIIGQGIAAATDNNVPVGFRRRTESDDWNDMGRGVARATCGLGDGLRQEVSRSQLDAIRTASAARGAPMTNGAVQVAAAPLSPAMPQQAQPIPAALPQTLAEVYAIMQPSRHYPQDEVMKARAYIRTLPQAVQEQLFGGLDDSSGTAWDVLVDRTRAYVVVTSLNGAAAPDVPHRVLDRSQQQDLRKYATRLPNDVLRQFVAGIDMTHGYPDAWYDRVALYQATHQG